ncbi:MAG: hypothetical protein JWM41_4496 [Gemmatimonadetes bacterium]|nr:hypothetical protein [Gemmatimonadota bacterium]
MRRFLAAGRAACWLFVFAISARGAGAQKWNDSLSLDLVNRATARRVRQLADTELTDYQATAHGYVTFLAQLGEGLRTPPKIIKADELQLEVYWHAPNLSKQRIVGRRDTLLLPTDIAYHADHLGIVQNNFPSVIRIGDGDEVRDVPHPLSPAGLLDYDFALTDSFAIGSGPQRIRVHEIKVRPKDDRQPRVVGAVYVDASGGEVVRMNLSFTRAAFVDQALEELSIILENRLVGGKFWLPNRQLIEIKRSGTWMDFPARGIIRGRWEIGDYRFNLKLPMTVYTGPEIVQVSPQQLKAYPWTGRVLDSLPPDVRAVTEEDVKRVQDEARALVRAQALARAQHATLSARNVSDLVHVNRVEGLALGSGVSKVLGSGVTGTARARYGIDDHDVLGAASVAWLHPSGFGVRLFGLRDFRDAGDVQERSSALNSLAAQEFGSDYTDPYLVRGGGAGLDFPTFLSFHWQLDGSVERQDSLEVHAHPVVRKFAPTVPAMARRLFRLSLGADRPPSLWLFGTELAMRGELRGTWDLRPTIVPGGTSTARTFRGAVSAELERPYGSNRLVSRTTAAGLSTLGFEPRQELVYLGGPISAPGYDYHSLIARAAVSQHLEWQFPVPFPAFSLGRFGRVPATASLAPFVHAAFVSRPTSGAGASDGVYPAVGTGFLTPFNLLRFDVARGVGRGGRWTFAVDVSREFWSIF